MGAHVVHSSLYAAGGVVLPIRSLGAPLGTPAGEARALLLDLVDDARDQAHLLLRSPAVAPLLADVTHPNPQQLRLLRDLVEWKRHTRHLAAERTRWRRAGRVGRALLRIRYALRLAPVGPELLPVIQGTDEACVPFSLDASRS